MEIRGFLACVALGLALAGCSERATDASAEDQPARLTPVDEAPVELEGAPDQPIGTYTNRKHGFAIAVPDNWVELRAATNEDGSIFESKPLDADLRVYGAANEGDAEFQEAVEALRDGTTDAEGTMVGDNEYRGEATDAEGYRIRLRVVRKPDAGMVSALVRYPVARAAALEPIAARTLDSLELN